MISKVTFGSSLGRLSLGHVEGELINPEHDIERLNVEKGAEPQNFGRVGTCYPNNYYLEITKDDTNPYEETDYAKYFTNKEIWQILEEIKAPEFECKKEYGKPDDTSENNYTLKIYKGDIVIDNKNITNRTIVIKRDGSVLNTGSENNIELADTGEYTNLYSKLLGEMNKRILKDKNLF